MICSNCGREEAIVEDFANKTDDNRKKLGEKCLLAHILESPSSHGFFLIDKAGKRVVH